MPAQNFLPAWLAAYPIIELLTSLKTYEAKISYENNEQALLECSEIAVNF